MPKQNKPPVTQRAYTLRLRGTDLNDQSWRDALWKTHEAINKGAKAFGDRLLTLRGGLDHSLVDTKVKGGKGNPDRDPTDEERKTRRILLALSWLSVESKLGAPENFIVASGEESAQDRNNKVIAALEEILKSRGVAENEIDQWKKDCSASLSAAIREDAVWVNRSKAFDCICGNEDKKKAREDAQTLLWFLLTDDYLAIPKKPVKASETTVLDDKKEETGDDSSGELIVKSGKGAGKRTRHPFSHIFGRETTKGFGNPLRTFNLRNFWRQYLKPKIEAAGIPLSDPNAKAKKKDPPSPTELHREMFSQAAARLAQIWTKQKQQELERVQRAAADDELKKLENDPAYNTVLKRLEMFCRERGQATGSLEEYRINPRAIEGWDRVVTAWENISETDNDRATEKRIEKAKDLKKDNPDKKFGDINLFIHLAEPEYEPVWRHNGQADPSILKTYVKGWKARTDAIRLKVAAFRHPDPYFHPVFCHFGVSRPPIKHNRLNKRSVDDTRIVQMLLWTECKAEYVQLLAISKRFDAEIGSAAESSRDASANVPEVARRSRLGVAAITKQGGGDTFCVANVFDQQEVRPRKGEDKDGTQEEGCNNESQDRKKKEPTWNGTLQADRLKLEAIGRLQSSEPQKALLAKQHLRWWLIVSLELQPTGPWYDYITVLSDKSPFLRTARKDEDKGEKRKQGAKYISWSGWPHDEVNKPLRKNKNGTGLEADPTSHRQSMAALILSRLPGLRVLSVDLGHRYAAACAVWEALSAEAFKKDIDGKKILRGGTDEKDLYCHTEHEADGKKHVTIYRRIGADKLPDGTPHPAPWARLDRQFLIKLQGEEEGVRQASNEEIWQVHQLEAALGRSKPLINRLISSGWGITKNQQSRIEALKKLGWCPPEQPESGDVSDADEEEIAYKPPLSVDELMSSAVRTMRLALKRHGDRARIAHYLITDEKTKPGGVKEKLDANGRTEMLQDALVLWHDLFSSRSWRDDAAKQLWDEHIIKLTGDKLPEEIGEDASESERGKKKKENREKLHDAAKALAQDESLRKTLHDLWKTRWEEDDRQWKKHLRWFSDWVLPRGKAAEDPAIRKVGGLSLTRLATLTEFRRKVQVGFFTRLHPDGTRAETKEQFGQSTLDALERMREQRVKQLASRIAEAALGIGSQDKRHWEGGNRPRRRINDPRFAPCHAVVIEDLTHYRPEETRTRRENRQLMTWSSSKVKKYLAEACQLYGLHFREIFAGYTSVQDSRTGAPGIRCQDVPVKEFMRSPFWRKQVKQAETKLLENKGDARERFLCSLNAMWKDKAVTDWERAGVVRLPLKGGEVFVSADPLSPAARGLQADLNAAANIGLRALTDSDWPGKWWYVPCESSSLRPVKEKVEGSAAVNPTQALPQSAQKQNDGAGAKKKRKGSGTGKPKEVVNLWRDVSSSPLDDPNAGEWKEYTAYQNEVQWRVVRILEEELKGRFQRLYEGAKEDGIPF